MQARISKHNVLSPSYNTEGKRQLWNAQFSHRICNALLSTRGRRAERRMRHSAITGPGDVTPRGVAEHAPLRPCARRLLRYGAAVPSCLAGRSVPSDLRPSLPHPGFSAPHGEDGDRAPRRVDKELGERGQERVVSAGPGAGGRRGAGGPSVCGRERGAGGGEVGAGGRTRGRGSALGDEPVRGRGPGRACYAPPGRSAGTGPGSAGSERPLPLWTGPRLSAPRNVPVSPAPRCPSP